VKLLLVESPTKAKTIAKILGKGFVVRATLGHIKDLPPTELGVDEEKLEGRYQWLKGKKKLVENIKKLARKAKGVYLGTDPDREGEAIAYFLREELKKVSREIKRVTFYEISEEGVKEGLKEAGEINMNMVYSQFARRILDRLIGYKISPELWKFYKNPRLSAGRVISPTLRLIVEREREIEGFKVRSYYYVVAIFEKGGVSFKAFYDKRYKDPSEAKELLQKIREGIFAVVSVKEELSSLPPPKPFTTSSLQSEASSKLGFPPEKTQALAQKLFEMGLITYPRTDSYRLSERKAKEFLQHIEKTYGKEYVGKLRKFREKPSSQGAHECIRPTTLEERSLSGDLSRLFNLINARTLASLMSDIKLLRQEGEIEVSSPHLKSPIKLKAKGTKVRFDGWSAVYPSEVAEEPLPPLSEGEILKPLRIVIEERKTQPPPRYTEGTLIKTLEKLGIGRPSTYATIVKTIKERGYVSRSGKSLKPTPIAFEVVDFLMRNFQSLMDYRFTAEMEKALDEVEEGKRFWKDVVREFFGKVWDGKG